MISRLFETTPLAPASEPSTPTDSTLTGALATGKGSCAALAAIALSLANDARVPLEAWVHGDHVVVAAPHDTGFFELLQGGRRHEWPLAAAKNERTAKGERVDATAFLGYYLDNLAVRLAEAGDAVRAEDAFHRAIASTPKAARLRFNYGTFLLNQKRTAEAITALHRSVELDAHNPDAWTNLGVALSQSGDNTKARRCFEHALRIDPWNANAHRNLDALVAGDRAGGSSPPR